MTLEEILEQYRAERAKDIARTEVVTKSGWNMSHHGRIVFHCPNCGEKSGVGADTTDGVPYELEYKCEHCGSLVQLALDWRVEPELVGVQFRLLQPDPAKEETTP